MSHDTWHGGPPKAQIRKMKDATDPMAAWLLWIPPNNLACYEGHDTRGGLLGLWGDTYWPSQQAACDMLAMHERDHAVVQIAGVVLAHYSHGQVTGITFSPSASYAGYFGASAHVVEGNISLDVGIDGPFWNAVRTMDDLTVDWVE